MNFVDLRYKPDHEIDEADGADGLRADVSGSASDKTIRTLAQLKAQDLISDNEAELLKDVVKSYAVAVTPDMAALIDETDPADPIARQFVPTIGELDYRPDEQSDPIGDDLRSPVRGLVHRYPDRVLLKAVGVCPVYCRFCFRREMVGPENNGNLSERDLDNALGYIADHPEIWEVIVSGGDPLVLSSRRVAELTQRLEEIPHVKVVRWHTRVPVVSPQMVTDELADALASSKLGVYVALHSNHPRELTEAAREACRKLSLRGVSLLSQSVLLRGVNDDVDTLEDLMRGFVATGIKPYYLHHMDRARGTGHFRVSIETGQALMRQLRQRLSGLALPTYALDLPGAHGKVPIGPDFIAQDDPETGSYVVTDPHGEQHRYQDTV